MRLHRKNYPCNDWHAVQLAISVVILVRNVISLISVLRGSLFNPKTVFHELILVRKQDGHQFVHSGSWMSEANPSPLPR